MNGKQLLESESAMSVKGARQSANRDKVSGLTAAGVPRNMRSFSRSPRRRENERTQRAESTTLSPCSASSRRLKSARLLGAALPAGKPKAAPRQWKVGLAQRPELGLQAVRLSVHPGVGKTVAHGALVHRALYLRVHSPINRIAEAQPLGLTPTFEI